MTENEKKLLFSMKKFFGILLSISSKTVSCKFVVIHNLFEIKMTKNRKKKFFTFQSFFLGNKASYENQILVLLEISLGLELVIVF